MTNLGTQMTGIERVIYEENLANRRKPRMYASFEFEFGADEHPYPLDFCLRLHRNYDGLLDAIKAHTLFEYTTW